jgi:hypothetical protein
MQMKIFNNVEIHRIKHIIMSRIEKSFEEISDSIDGIDLQKGTFNKGIPENHYPIRYHLNTYFYEVHSRLSSMGNDLTGTKRQLIEDFIEKLLVPEFTKVLVIVESITLVTGDNDTDLTPLQSKVRCEVCTFYAKIVCSTNQLININEFTVCNSGDHDMIVDTPCGSHCRKCGVVYEERLF